MITLKELQQRQKNLIHEARLIPWWSVNARQVLLRDALDLTPLILEAGMRDSFMARKLFEDSET